MPPTPAPVISRIAQLGHTVYTVLAHSDCKHFHATLSTRKARHPQYQIREPSPKTKSCHALISIHQSNSDSDSDSDEWPPKPGCKDHLGLFMAMALVLPARDRDITESFWEFIGGPPGRKSERSGRDTGPNLVRDYKTGTSDAHEPESPFPVRWPMADGRCPAR